MKMSSFSKLNTALCFWRKGRPITTGLIRFSITLNSSLKRMFASKGEALLMENDRRIFPRIFTGVLLIPMQIVGSKEMME